jgi:hypothetical protein
MTTGKPHQFKIGHEENGESIKCICTNLMRYNPHNLTNEIAYFGYVDRYNSILYYRFSSVNTKTKSSAAL